MNFIHASNCYTRYSRQFLSCISLNFTVKSVLALIRLAGISIYSHFSVKLGLKKVQCHFYFKSAQIFFSECNLYLKVNMNNRKLYLF